jgi:hypothetical protein
MEKSIQDICLGIFHPASVPRHLEVDAQRPRCRRFPRGEDPTPAQPAPAKKKETPRRSAEATCFFTTSPRPFSRTAREPGAVGSGTIPTCPLTTRLGLEPGYSPNAPRIVGVFRLPDR